MNANIEKAADGTTAASPGTTTPPADTTSPPTAPTSVVLISPSSSPGNDSTPTYRISGVSSGNTVKLYSDSSCTTLVATGTASGSTIDLTASAQGAGSYTFSSLQSNTAGNSSCSTPSSAYVLDLTAPSAPSALALSSPASSPGTDTTPTILVSGVTSGDTVQLYTDSSCTTSVASSVASGATVLLTASTLSDATFDFYSRATDPAGNTSSCSVATVAYYLGTSVGSISYTQPTSFVSKGNAITALTPTVSGRVTSYSISPSLPTGLSINASTGVISGTPTQISVPTTYTISAWSGGSTISATVSLEVPITLTVNSTTDAADATPGDEICATSGAVCTLRAAAQEAAALTAGVLTRISLPANTYTLSSTGLSITSRVELTGAGSATTIITANNLFATVINVNTSRAVTIDAVTVKEGKALTNGTYNGVGIYSISDSFVLKNCEVSSNTAANGVTGTISGLGVYWAGASGSTFTMTSCTVSGNSRTNTSSSQQGYGGGLYLGGSGTFTITSSTIQSNTMDMTGTSAKSRGGGIYSSISGQITSSTISNNHQAASFAGHGGGGIYLSAGDLTISNSTCASNTGRYGGFIQTDSGGVVTISTSSITSNTSNSSGSAIFLNGAGTIDLSRTLISGSGDLIYDNGGGSAQSSIKNSTLYSAGTGNNMVLSFVDYTLDHVTIQHANASGSGIYVSDSTFTMKNSIVDKTSGGNSCVISNGTVTSGGYNVARDTSCAFLVGTGDLQSTNPDLVALASNGGPTQTMALNSSSTIINLIPSGSCTLATDQRGNSRPNGGGCDPGAYEY